MSSESLRYPGDVIITDMSIVSSNGNSVNIFPQVITFDLVENLFTPWLSGTLTVMDGQGINEILPLVGNEFLNIAFHTPGLTGFNNQFYIYSISDKKQVKPNVIGYALKFISKEALTAVNLPVSKTFRGSAESIIDTLISEHLLSKKTLKFDISTNSFAFISNFWNVTQCINYVLKHALDVNGFPTYTLYENKDGFNFKSVNEFIDSEIPAKYAFSTILRKPIENGEVITDVSTEYSTIQTINYSDASDFFERIKSGYYGSNVLSFDTTTGNYSYISHMDLEGYNKLNSANSFSDSEIGTPFANFSYVPRMYNNIEDTQDNTNYKSKADRKMFFSRLQNRILKIKVWGRTDYTVGEKAVVLLPKNTQTNEDENNIDEYISGTYMITSIRHVITPNNKHYASLELCNDGFNKDLNTYASNTSTQTS